MKRVTKKDCEKAFKNLTQILNKKNWVLDYNPTYGGAIIFEPLPGTTGMRNAVVGYRLKPREFVNAIEFALNVLSVYIQDQN